MKKSLFAVLAVLCISSISFGQLKQGTWGITTGLAGTPTLGIVYAIQSNLRLAGNLGFSSTSTGGVSGSTFTIGVTPWYYLGTSENVSAFVGGTIGFTSTSGGGVSSTGFNIAGNFGAEYWFSPKFSWDGFLGLGFTSSGPSGATTSTFGTSTSTGLTWYF